LWIGLAEILERFAADPAVKVVGLTGAGRKAFVSGADISQFDQLRNDADAQQEYDRMTAAGRAAMAGFTKPMIAEIRGFCLGGG
jgi:enoyl-CoA hydratase